jgi:RNA-directed DNA polymerase
MNKHEFSSSIGLPLNYLERTARRSKFLYQAFQIKKRNGSERQIESPNQELKGIQSWILTNILEAVPLSDSVHGFRKNHSIRTNALPHLGRHYLISFDIKDFFPSITSEKVFNAIKDTTSCNDDLTLMIVSLCTYENHLPQGGVTSPCLANIVFTNIDRAIENICNRSRVVYTRYADDLTLSSNDKPRLHKMFESIQKIIESDGFTLNESKTRYISRKNRVLVTGLTLNSEKLSIGRTTKKNLRSQIYRYIICSDKTMENQIIGMLSYLKNIEPDTYASFLVYINRLKRKSAEQSLQLDSAP